jgi:hypothetical protein
LPGENEEDHENIQFAQASGRDFNPGTLKKKKEHKPLQCDIQSEF